VQLPEGGFEVVYRLALLSPSSGVAKVLFRCALQLLVVTFTFTLRSLKLPCPLQALLKSSSVGCDVPPHFIALRTSSERTVNFTRGPGSSGEPDHPGAPTPATTPCGRPPAAN